MADKVKFDKVLESGDGNRESVAGGVRDKIKGKGRFDLITPFGLERVARHYENGAVKYSDRNWEKGLPLSWFLDSLERHTNQMKKCLLLGVPPEEDHMAAITWNAMGYMHTAEMIGRGQLPIELDDLPNAEGRYSRGSHKHKVDEVEAIGGKNCGEGNKPDCRKCRHYAGGAGVTEKCDPANGTCWEPEV